ncbi:MAG: methyltransferase [Halobacteriota archaeon]|nr:methyltransferase [Halobacteriota archaeon]
MMLIILVLIPILYFDDFSEHFYVYLTGNVLTSVITEEWEIVLLSVMLFLLFLIPLSFRRKANWAEYGLATAFFVSLFVEMYGIPLTILFASKYFYSAETPPPPNIVEFNLLGVGFGMDLAMTYGAVLMIIGALLIIVGWITLYRNIKDGGPVTVGIYSISRHPQYLGFILIIVGWLIGWPTILTVILAPILIFMYIRLCKTEEKEMAEIVEYQSYIKRVPFLI